MKYFRSFSVLIICSMLNFSVGAEESDSQTMQQEQIAKMDSQMQAMREMHEKMAQAKTQKERQALMSAHMKTMQDGMSMIHNMPIMGGMGMGGTMGKGNRKNYGGQMDCGSADMQHQMMTKRMQMMENMMQMMMDRMPSQ